MMDIVLIVNDVVYLLENSKQMQHRRMKRGTNVDLKQSFKVHYGNWKNKFYNIGLNGHIKLLSVKRFISTNNDVTDSYCNHYTTGVQQPPVNTSPLKKE